MATPTLVQAISGQSSIQYNITGYELPAPHAVRSGNTVIVFVQSSAGATPSSVVDDTGANTYTKLLEKDNGDQRTSLWYSANITNGPRKVTIAWGSNRQDAQVAWVEFSNLDAAPADGSSSNSGAAGTAWTAGTFAPTSAADGALYLGYGVQTSDRNSQATLAANSPFSLISSDIITGNAVLMYINPLHATQNMALTSSASKKFNMIAGAFKNATSGSSGISGARVIRMFNYTLKDDQNDPPGTFTAHYPCSSGTLLHMIWNGAAGLQATGVVDSNSNTWQEVLVSGAGGGYNDTGPGRVQHWYAYGPTCSANMTITVTYGAAGATLDTNMILLEIVGVPTGADPFDTYGLTNGNSLVAGEDVTGATLSPSTANGLVISYIAAATGGGSNVTANAFGNFCGPKSTPVIATSPVGENQGCTIYKNPSSGSMTNLYTTVGSQSIGKWADFAVAYKTASSPTLTSINPTTGVQGTTVPVAFVGTNFDGANLAVQVSGTGVTPGTPSSVTATGFNCDFVISGAASADARTVTVSTDGGTTGTKTFTVTSSGGGGSSAVRKMVTRKYQMRWRNRFPVLS